MQQLRQHSAHQTIQQPSHQSQVSKSLRTNISTSVVWLYFHRFLEKWSSWTSCSVTCGNGTRQRRSRVCTSGSPQRSNCSLNIEQLSCTMTSCIEPASWGQWSQWSPCSVTCANGRQLRSRNCTGGGARPEDKLSKVIKCRGSDQDMRNCSRPACPSKYSEITFIKASNVFIGTSDIF
jgi:hypothetical protein